MHSATHLHARWSKPNNPWKNADHPLQHKGRLPLPLHLKPKPLQSRQTIEALKTSSGCHSEKGQKEEKEGDDNGAGRNERGGEGLARLSIRIRRGDRSLRYVLDGGRLRAEGFHNRLLCCNGINDLTRFAKCWFEISSSALRELFVPRQVGPSYMNYLKWKLMHRIFSSTLQVLATQAMLRAIGVGHSRSLPSAAAFNWVLKDGLGRLSRCIYTVSVGSAFDTNLKRIRFSTSVLFSLSMGIEMLTPLFPQYFLILATIANVAKSISLAAYIATSSAIHRSFAIADNLGEISAKSQIQTVCFDNIGLLLAAALNLLWKSNQRLQVVLPLMLYPFFAAMDLYSIFRGLKHVHLQTLNKDRLEIIINNWIAYGFVPSPSEASIEEDNIIWGNGSGSPPFTIRIGCVNPEGPPLKFLEQTLASLGTDEMHFICLEISRVGLASKQQASLLLCLHERACTLDILRGMLEACHLRESLLKGKTKCLSVSLQVRHAEQSVVDISYKHWCEMRMDSRKFAECQVGLLVEGIKRSGWAMKNILLNSTEKMRFSLEI